jgi:glycosyltransferase involved in cell wall biosynthesis
LKILIIAPTPFFADRGAHVQIYEQIISLQHLKHEVKLVTYGLGRDIDKIDTIRCFNPIWYSKQEAGPSFTKILLIPVLGLKARRAAKNFKPDVIHAHLHEGALIARLFCPKYKNKTIFDYQGSLSGEVGQHVPGLRNLFINGILKKIEARINSLFPIVTQSQKMLLEIEDLAKKSGNKLRSQVVNVGDGVDINRFFPRDSDAKLTMEYNLNRFDNVLVFMGYLAAYQGVDLMLEAFKIFLQKNPTACLFIIGYPVSIHYLELCKKLEIERQTIFVGKVDYFDVPRYLSVGNIAIAPKISATEGDGKIYNYMAMALPIVTFDREVSREILGDSAIYCNEISASSLAIGMQKALGEKVLGLKARNRAIELLSWDGVASRITHVYLKSRNELAT